MSLRIQRVGELIRRELSMILEKDYSFDGALVTIHDVRPTQDLKQCFIYVGVLGKQHQQTAVLEKLGKERAFLQKALYKRVILKNSPQLFFRLDHSVERGVSLINVIDSLPPFLPDMTEEEIAAEEASRKKPKAKPEPESKSE